MDKICLVALIGLPASGKTSFCKLLLKMENLSFCTMHICYDNFLKFSDNPNESYREQREELLKSLADVIEHFKSKTTWDNNVFNFEFCSYRDSAKEELVILCDDNNYYSSMRYKLYQLARKYCISYGQIFFDINDQIAMQRNSAREAPVRVPKEVFEKMMYRLEIPKLSKNSWENNTFVIKDSDDSLKEQFIHLNFIPFVANLLENPLKSNETVSNNGPTKQSRIHDLDLLMRKLIGNKIKCLTNNKQVIAFQLNNKRKNILKEYQDSKENMETDFERLLCRFEDDIEYIDEDCKKV
ncbi:phosphoseryl tRNA kinase [Haematobia irritans]|uniref:phosphoseryl tRNA kinase n=1 Tax=Haematobia irritans TaxID=7368 RepID=UPI003F506E79